MDSPAARLSIWKEDLICDAARLSDDEYIERCRACFDWVLATCTEPDRNPQYARHSELQLALLAETVFLPLRGDQHPSANRAWRHLRQSAAIRRFVRDDILLNEAFAQARADYVAECARAKWDELLQEVAAQAVLWQSAWNSEALLLALNRRKIGGFAAAARQAAEQFADVPETVAAAKKYLRRYEDAA